MTVVTADRETDHRYGDLQARFGADDPRVNGYVSGRFFRRELRIAGELLAVPGLPMGPVVDVACGTGLVAAGVLSDAGARAVVGMDFNAAACTGARDRGVAVARADAFRLPLAEGTAAAVLNCQFLNQQPVHALEPFLVEAARVLMPGGRLVLLWRGQSLAHRGVQALRQAFPEGRADTAFPQVNHTLASVRDEAAAAGFQALRAGVTLPLGPLRLAAPDGLTARFAGASNCLLAQREGESR